MSETLHVYLDGVRIGTLSQASQGSLGFVYDEDYLALVDPTPLSLSIPLHTGAHANRVVRAFLEGLLPDNQAVRERWGATYGVSANNPFALLRHVGRDAAGAVQILPADAASTDTAQRCGDIDWLTGSTAFTRRTSARLFPSTPARNTRPTAGPEWARSPISSPGSL